MNSKGLNMDYEWVYLLLKAKEQGYTITEIKAFIDREKKKNVHDSWWWYDLIDQKYGHFTHRLFWATAQIVSFLHLEIIKFLQEEMRQSENFED